MLQLKELEKYDTITIQCHDNPDGDAIGSGFGLYSYFKYIGKKVRLIYSGRNQIHKANLILMVEELDIPIEYVDMKETDRHIEGLLITVDCQYGAGNVTKLDADAVAIIDHHQIEITNCPMSRIEPFYDSCSTLVWKMLNEGGYQITNVRVGTALYYGLYTDSNQLTEVFNPNDMDMRDEILYDPSVILKLKQSNLSLQELEIAGIALLRSIYNADYHYAVVKTKPCDPNLLGLISDFLIQVAEIHSCVVYNEQDDGYKLSVRSCNKEVHANELVAYLTDKIGSGGGHTDKAGGFVNRKLYEAKHPTLNTQSFFGSRMAQFFDHNAVIYAATYEPELSGMHEFKHKVISLGYVNPIDIFPVGTPITIRSMDGDLNLIIDGNQYIMIGLHGEVYLRTKEEFGRWNRIRAGKMPKLKELSYRPIVKNNLDNSVVELLPYAGKCESIGDIEVYAKKLTKTVKIFPVGNDVQYQLGRPGDYLCIRKDDMQDIFIVEKSLFTKVYQRITAKKKADAR